jgi:lanosterol synthase
MGTKSHANGSSTRAGTNGAVKGAGDAKTDYSRWRLHDDRGCQIWHYLETEEEVEAWPQSTADKYFLGLDTVSKVWRRTQDNLST